MPRDTLIYARKYLELGYSVIPVKSSQKGGAPFPWGKYQNQRPTEEDIEQWWGDNGDYKDMGIAIVTGEISGLVVLDLDRHGEVDGLVQAKNQFGHYSGDAPSVLTGGGGLHEFYRYPGKKVPSGTILPGIDVKADGGFVYAPPSRHPSGDTYEWEAPPWEYDEIPDPPSWVLDEIRKVQQGTTRGQQLTESEWTKLLQEGVPEGERNNRAIRIAGHYLGKGLDVEAVRILLYQWNQRCKPPLESEEIEDIIARISLKEQHKKGALPDETTREMDEDNRAAGLEAIREKFRVPLSKIQRVAGAQPRYRLHANSSVVEIDAKHLINQGKFRQAVFSVARELPDRVGKKDDPGWDYWVELMDKVAEDIEPGEDATIRGELRAWLTDYLGQARVRPPGQEGPSNCPRQDDDGLIYLHLQRFLAHLRGQLSKHLSQQEMAQRLAAAGCGKARLRVTSPEGETKQVRFWTVPGSLLERDDE